MDSKLLDAVRPNIGIVDIDLFVIANRAFGRVKIQGEIYDPPQKDDNPFGDFDV